MKRQGHQRNTGRVTLADVAREAEVSRNVVSLVLNNRLHPVIRYSEVTAARIRETAKALGYRPNRSSRAHFGGAHGSIGVLGDNLFQLPRAAAAAIQQEAADRDQLIIFDRFNQRPNKLPALVKESAVDGLIVVNELPPHVARAIERARIPTVWVDTDRRDGPGVVVPDEAGGIALAVEHLVAGGRTRLLHIDLRRDSRACWTERVDGFIRATRRHRLADAETITWTPPMGKTETGEHLYVNAEALTSVLVERPRVDGVIIESWNAAILYRALRMLGRRIPEDVAVVGCEEVELVTSHLEPSLTGVGASGEEMGRAAVQLLNRMIAGHSADRVLIPCTLTARRSSRHDAVPSPQAG